jgi:pimeloyl-ACP methyl ester carboxylesterase
MSTTMSKPTRTGHVPVNGVTYYYEIHGSGQPLLLLHGGLMSLDSFKDVVLPALVAANREVIAVDLQGHGRSTLGDRPIDLVAIGDDLSAILDKLGYKQVDAMGYSFGSGAAFRLAVQHPAQIRKLVLVSGAYSRDGFFAEMLPMQAQLGAAMADMMKETPMYKLYMAVAPNKADFPRLLDRMGELMRRPYDWSDDVKKLPMPVMLVWGDADMMRLEHIVEFYKLLGGGQRDAGWQREHMAKNRLAILPDVTHYEMGESPALVPTVLPFLTGN